jgi:hypothetical protein
VIDRIKENPHVGYVVNDLDAAVAGHEVIGGPWEAEQEGRGRVRVMFVEVDGALVEFLEYETFDGGES